MTILGRLVVVAGTALAFQASGRAPSVVSIPLALVMIPTKDMV